MNWYKIALTQTLTQEDADTMQSQLAQNAVTQPMQQPQQTEPVNLKKQPLVQKQNEARDVKPQPSLPIVTPGDLNLAEEQQPKQQKNDLKIQKKTTQPAHATKQYPDFPDKQIALRWAMNNHEVLWIKYITSNGNIIERNVQPHGIYNAGTHNRIIVVWDEDMNDVRGFIAKQIKEYKFLGRKFNNKFIFRPN